jgi:hypothetical protein
MKKHYGFLKLRTYDDQLCCLVHPQRVSWRVRYDSQRGAEQLMELERDMRHRYADQNGFWLEGPAACEMPIFYDDESTIYGIFPRLSMITDPADLKSLVLVSGVWVGAPRSCLPHHIRTWRTYVVPRSAQGSEKLEAKKSPAQDPPATIA